MEKRYRYFWTLLAAQSRWLNKMADRGLRLSRTEKLLYEFQPCAPGQYRYCVEFVAHLSREKAEDYARFLEDCGYRTWFKNANLDWNVGKVVGRPWAEPGGRLASNATTYNRELLIVEKENDGKPFRLHTALEDQIRYRKAQRRPALFLLAVMTPLAALTRSWPAALFAALALAVLIRHQLALARLKKQGGISED
ncbi:MAG: DUF2812 domain-containing protein [Oscillospiraceae bacterium]|jgi:hypothetical protein|nr:DUF2812 domain-containing protein [Oscillospiraceae bacterium]